MIEQIYKGLLLAEMAIVISLAIFALSTRLTVRERVHINFMTSFSLYGVALLIWGAALILLRTTYWRVDAPLIAAAVSMSSCHIFLRIISQSLLTLLNIKCIERLSSSFISWLVVSLILFVVAIHIDNHVAEILMWIMYALFIVDLMFVALRTKIVYQQRDISCYTNGDIELFIRCMRYCAIVLMLWCMVNPICGLFPAPWRVGINVVSIVVFIVLSLLFQSYAIYIQPINMTIARPTGGTRNRLDRPVEEWIARRGYLESMTSAQNVSAILGTNRTYLSSYINERYGMDFRNWIAGLRLEFSKELMTNNPDISLNEVARQVQYTQSSFSAIFKRHYGISVIQWRRTISQDE